MLLFWLHFAIEASKVAHFQQDHCGVREYGHGTGALALSLIIICFGCECQLNACKVKIQKLCSRHAQSRVKQTDESMLSKEQGLFSLSLFPRFLLCSLCIKIPWPLFSSKLHLFTCLVIVQSHCFYHLPTPLTDHVILK